MKKNSKIYVAGHRGLVGSAIVRELERQGFTNILMRTRAKLDLLDQSATDIFFAKEKPEYVFCAAAKVGGIWANKNKKAEFIYQNLQVQNNLIHNAYKYKAKKLLFLGSSCIYPRQFPQPIKEEYLLTGPLEETNNAYAVAKIAGITMCQSYNQQYGTNFISVMPTNLYGINDNFDLESAHVLPSLLRKFHEAKINKSPKVEVWGTGSPMREFLFVDDLASAVVFLMKNYDGSEFINIGTGEDCTIKELAEMIKEVVGYKGEIYWNTDKPDGTPRKLLDVSKLNKLGWKYKTDLKSGIRKTYKWFIKQKKL
jgi:GDP-L-fucose synthase